MAVYLITFSTYGSRLPGDERSSVSQTRNSPGMSRAGPHRGLEEASRSSMSGKPVVLSFREREVVDAAIRYVAGRRGWGLGALNVRTNHVHAVVSAERPPEDVMVAMKAWATRFLSDAGLRERGARVWTIHRSTRWLKTGASVEAAMNYVLFEQ